MDYPENRILPDVPAHVYHGLPRVGGSSLRHLLRSAAHYRQEQLAQDKHMDAKQLGSVLHQTICPSPSVRLVKCETIWKGEGRRDLKAMQARRDGYGPDVLEVTEEHEQVRQAVHAAVWAHPEAAKLLRGASYESSFLWTDPATGVACKGRADILTGEGVCVDLKTTALSAEAKVFERQIAEGGYHLQAAHYMAFGLETGLVDAQRWLWIVAETTEPFGVAVYEMDKFSLMHAQDERRRALERLARAQNTGLWEGYDSRVRHLGVPDYRLPLNLRLSRWNDTDIRYATGGQPEDDDD